MQSTSLLAAKEDVDTRIRGHDDGGSAARAFPTPAGVSSARQ